MSDVMDMEPSSPVWLPDDIDFEGCKSIYHADWRDHLNKKNIDEVTQLLALPSNTYRYMVYTRKIGQFFATCVNNLGLPPEVSYLALDIYDRFWTLYFTEKSSNLSQWSAIEDSDMLTKECCLISFSCMQLASKICCTNKMIPVIVIVESMEHFGINVDKSCVMAYERLVFRTVRWKMPNVTVLSYVEMFLEDMSGMLVGIKLSELLKVSLKVINVTNLFHRDIYSKLYFAFKRRPLLDHSQRRNFLSVEGDLVRLAASVICTSAMLYDPTNALADDIIAYLATTTSYQACEIRVLSQIIAHVILRANSKSNITPC